MIEVYDIQVSKNDNGDIEIKQMDGVNSQSGYASIFLTLEQVELFKKIITSVASGE